MKQFLKNIFQNKEGKDLFQKPSKRTGYILVIGLLGILFFIVGNVFSSSPDNEEITATDPNTSIEQAAKQSAANHDYSTTDVGELEKSYEKDLSEMLNKIQGVSETEVMVNLESTKVKVYEKNLIAGQQTTDEADKNGGIRKVSDSTEETQVVLVRQADTEAPILVQTNKPKVRGVFVVAKGADHATVKKWIIESVARVLDVPTHKVSVMPKN